jgi:hypothetical protein
VVCVALVALIVAVTVAAIEVLAELVRAVA